MLVWLYDELDCGTDPEKNAFVLFLGLFALYLLLDFNLMHSLAQLLCSCIVSWHKRSATGTGTSGGRELDWFPLLVEAA